MKKLGILILLLLWLSAPVSAIEGYDLIHGFSDDTARVVQDLKWGLVDPSLKVVLPLQWDYLGDLCEDRRLMMQNQLYGFLDEKGKTVVHARYKQAGNFSQGLVCVKNQEDAWGYIDKNGKEVLPFIYEDAENFSEGLALVKQDGQWYFIDELGKNISLSAYEEVYSFSEGLACVKRDGLYGFIDTTGKEAISPTFDLAFDFAGGGAVVQSGGRYGLIDSSGSYLINPTWEVLSSGIRSGYLQASKNGKWALIDTNGKSLSAFDYDWIGDFSEGLCPVSLGGKYGFINQSFQLEIPAEWDYAGAFSEGMAPVCKDGMWGYIDTDGQQVSALAYSQCSNISHGYALVCDDGGDWQYVPPTKLKQSEIFSELLTESEDERIGEDIEKPEKRLLKLQIGQNFMEHGEKKIQLDAPPIIYQDMTFMPIRAVIEAIGGAVIWEADTQKVKINCGNHSLVLRIGEMGAVADGRMTLLSAPPLIQHDRTLIPLRFVMEHLDCRLTWMPETRTILISY